MSKLPYKESRLIVIFILAVIVSGSILTYLSISHISNYRELMEKKISEEERDLTLQFSSNFQKSLDSVTALFTSTIIKDTLRDKKIHPINDYFNYVVINDQGLFIKPHFSENILITDVGNSSVNYLNKIKTAQNNEFILKDFRRAEKLYISCLDIATRIDSANVYNALSRLYIKLNLPQKAIDTYKTILIKFSSTANSSGFPYSYFSIIKLLQISNTSNTEQLEEILTLFLTELANGEIPLNDSSQDLLNSIDEWKKNYDVNNSEIEELIYSCESALELIRNYKTPIQNLIVNENISNISSKNAIKINPISSERDEIMLFYNRQQESFGLILKLDDIYNQTRQKQFTSGFSFEYNIDLMKNNNSNSLPNSNLIKYHEFSPYFENSLIKISLQNEKIIDQYVLKRTVIYSLGLILFIGIMLFGLYLLIQDVKREKKLNKLRADFVSNVTHELKTPLTSINMFAEALHLNKESLDQRQLKYTESIVRESEKLKRMINNILEFSKKEDDKLQFKLKKTNLSELVKETVNELHYFLEISKIDLQLEIGDNLIAQIHKDGIKQAFSNLISNAIKYSGKKKKITIRLYEKNKEIYLVVEDFGLGIPKDKLQYIFEKFYRVNTGENETISGTGLGLTVTKAIIEEQGGKLQVESTFGKGSKFSIVLKSI